MSNRDEIDGLMMLFRAMGGEENVVEHMEKEGQSLAVNNTMMAKEMRPSREEWEKLGFSFTDIPYDDVLCKAVMPEGWSLKSTDHAMWNEIFDENGMKRGSMFYKASFYDRSAHMSLERRYGVCVDYIGEDFSTIEVYFGNSSEKLFVAGRVQIPQNGCRAKRLDCYEEEDRLKEVAKRFGDENYPDWENVHAYWNKSQNLSLKQTKKNND